MATSCRPALVAACVCALGGLLTACGPGRGAPKWIAADAAEIRCTVSGKDRIQPVLAAIPTPPVPTGLYARQLDPQALDTLGYQRDQPACATLLPPSESELETAAMSVDELLKIHTEASNQASELGRACVCEAAARTGSLSLIQHCFGVPTRDNCEITDELVQGVRDALVPLALAAQQATIPLVHWRLSGITDRPGWFLHKQNRLVALYEHGSDFFTRGNPIPDTTEYALLGALLEADHVTAVVRQDAGRALLVVREIGDELILDRFEYPEITGQRLGLVRYWESQHIDDFLARLQPPADTITPMVDPRLGNFVEISMAELERVDVGLVAASKLSPQPYKVSDEARLEPELMVDRAVVQALFGKGGKVLQGEVRLSEAGVQWALLLEGGLLTPTLDELDQAEPIAFRPPKVLRPPEFVLRGTGTNELWAHGLRALPRPLAHIERTTPGTINGTLEKFELKLPSGLPPDMVIDPVLASLAAWIQREPLAVTGGFHKDRSRVLFTVEPR